MKKVMGKLLSAMLILTLVFTSASVAFADSSETGAGEMKAEVSSVQTEDAADTAAISQDVEKQVKAAAVEKAATTKAVGNLSYITMTTGNETPSAVTFGYTAADRVNSSKAGIAKRIYLPAKGTFVMAVGNSSQSTSSIHYGLYRDAQLSSEVDSLSSSRGTTTSWTIKVPAAGYYYMGVFSYSYSGTDMSVVGSVAAAYVNGTDRTIYNKKQIAVGQKDAQTNYFKFKAVRNGYLKVQSSEGYDKVTLCNSKKKALSNAVSTNYSPTFGVKKGKTYYVKVAAGYNSDGAYALKVTNSTISEKSGKKKSRAVLLKKKRTKKGTIVAGEKRTDWYKFRVTKRKTVRITMKGATNDELKVAVYKGGRNIGRGTLYESRGGVKLKSLGKLSKGTYYIKVYRGNKKSSGWYSLSWR